MNIPPIIQQTPAILKYAQNAHHIDVKTFTGDCTLREFIAGMFSYYPAWIKMLYRIRWGFVRVLGMKQEGIPQMHHMRPEDVNFTKGEKQAFFTVHDAQEDAYWIAGASESHLTAYLGVIADPTTTAKQFHVVTIVYHHRWTGRVYFNVIRPFHHVVVHQMGQAGVRA
ncbi:MAG: DUF2867 domain-containing protein [Anaerolineae bacterium]|nr:DUF2867 domain-containing protein [Anaerolineae bacterium]